METIKDITVSVWISANKLTSFTTALSLVESGVENVTKRGVELFKDKHTVLHTHKYYDGLINLNVPFVLYTGYILLGKKIGKELLQTKP